MESSPATERNTQWSQRAAQRRPAVVGKDASNLFNRSNRIQSPSQTHTEDTPDCSLFLRDIAMSTGVAICMAIAQYIIGYRSMGLRIADTTEVLQRPITHHIFDATGVLVMISSLAIGVSLKNKDGLRVLAALISLGLGAVVKMNLSQDTQLENHDDSVVYETWTNEAKFIYTFCSFLTLIGCMTILGNVLNTVVDCCTNVTRRNAHQA